MCTNEMQKQAIKDYEAYTREQFQAHTKPELFPSDFERPGKCETPYCDKTCKNDYQKCYKNCGGKVEKTSTCKFLCF